MSKIDKTNQRELSQHTERNIKKQQRQSSGLWCNLQFSIYLKLGCIILIAQLQELIYFPPSLSYVELGFHHNLFCGELIYNSQTSSIILRRLYHVNSTFLGITIHNFNVKFTSSVFVCLCLHAYVQVHLFLQCKQSGTHTKTQEKRRINLG